MVAVDDESTCSRAAPPSGARLGAGVVGYATSLSDERTFAEVKRASSAGLSGTEILERVAEGLGRSVAFAAFCASTVDPASNLMVHGIARGMDGGEDESPNVYLERIYFEEDLEKGIRLARSRRGVGLLSEATGGDPERSLRYRELLKPSGLGHEMSAAFSADGSLWGGMDFIRQAGERDFSPRETALLRRLVPHVGAGLKVAALRRRADHDDAVGNGSGPGSPGVLTLDRAGAVVSHTPAAERLLRDLADLRPGWRDGEPPIPVLMVATAARRALSPRCNTDRDLVPRLRARGRSGRWLTLHASPTEPRNGRPSETVVVIEPSRPEEVAWLNTAAHGLTRREEEVVRLVVQGLSTAGISTRLFISEHTVQRHLQNAFEKVGVGSRRELLKRLFFEDLLPANAHG